MRRTFLLWLFAPALVACAARTELGDTSDEEDASLDVSLDAEPPPEDATLPDAPPPPPPEDASIDVIVIDAGPPPIDATPPPIDAPDDAPVPSCPDTCFSNHECQKQCTPQLSSGRYCCDQETNTCYAWAGKHCPIAIVDAGFD